MLAALLAAAHGAPAAPAAYAPAPYAESYPDIAPSYNVSTPIVHPQERNREENFRTDS